MIDLNLFLALVSFYFVMYVTPGPNNAMVLASGIKFGFSKTIPHMSGITIGHVIQVVLVCLGLGKLFQMFPQIQNILRIICALYLLYLGYKIIGSFSKIKEDDSRPLKFYEKLIISILFISITALMICPISISVWAAFGSGIKNLVKNNKKKAIVEYFLAILLSITALLIVIEK